MDDAVDCHGEADRWTGLGGALSVNEGFFAAFKLASEEMWSNKSIRENVWGFQLQPGTRWNPGLSDGEIREYEAVVDISFPSVFCTYLREMNGTDKPAIDIRGNSGENHRFGPGFYSYPRDLEMVRGRIKWIHAPGCPLRTAEELRADPKFTRTEEILGFTAYVLSEHPAKDLLIENYFVPELGGGRPFKQVTAYSNGPRFVSEPISVTQGEPDAIDITGPDYLVIEQVPIFCRNLGEQLLAKPDAVYPAEALALGLSGSVNVTVTVDETGRVIFAGARAGSGPQSLREAAIEAAYKASFKPIIVEGRPAVAQGFIDYQFLLPK